MLTVLASWIGAISVAWSAPGPGPTIGAKLGVGVFLVAAPDMPDPRFRHAVILMVAHSAHGAQGFIVNRPTHLTVHDAFPDTDENDGRKHQVYFGGPVAPTSFALLHRDQSAAQTSTHILNDVYLTSGREILRHLVKSADAKSLRTVFGYAGWAPGQLEREIATGSWDIRGASSELVFSSDPDALWQRLSRRPAGRLIRFSPGSFPALRARPGAVRQAGPQAVRAGAGPAIAGRAYTQPAP